MFSYGKIVQPIYNVLVVNTPALWCESGDLRRCHCGKYYRGMEK